MCKTHTIALYASCVDLHTRGLMQACWRHIERQITQTPNSTNSTRSIYEPRLADIRNEDFRSRSKDEENDRNLHMKVDNSISDVVAMTGMGIAILYTIYTRWLTGDRSMVCSNFYLKSADIGSKLAASLNSISSIKMGWIAVDHTCTHSSTQPQPWRLTSSGSLCSHCRSGFRCACVLMSKDQDQQHVNINGSRDTMRVPRAMQILSVT